MTEGNSISSSIKVCVVNCVSCTYVLLHVLPFTGTKGCFHTQATWSCPIVNWTKQAMPGGTDNDRWHYGAHSPFPSRLVSLLRACDCLKRLEQKPHLTVVLPSLDWAKSHVPAFSAEICLWMGQQSSTQSETGNCHYRFSIKSNLRLEIPSQSSKSLMCIVTLVRDRLVLWIYAINMTKDIPSLFCSDRCTA